VSGSDDKAGINAHPRYTDSECQIVGCATFDTSRRAESIVGDGSSCSNLTGVRDAAGE
jgi:hypothetical protein